MIICSKWWKEEKTRKFSGQKTYSILNKKELNT